MRFTKHLALLLALFILLGIGAPVAQATVVRVATIAAAGGANGATTTGVDTTGANLIVVYVTSLTAVSDATISDSNSNTCTFGTRQTTANAYIRPCYYINPTVGSGHTFTVSSSSGHSTIGGFAYSGGSGGIDQQNSNFDNSGSVGFLNTGSVTPGVSGEVLVTGLCFAQPLSGTPTIDSGFASAAPVYLNQATNNQGLAVSDLIETTATAKNPYWTFTAVFYIGTSIATFQPGGGGGAVVLTRALLGIGK